MTNTMSWSLLLKDIRKYPVLSKDVERELLIEAKNGDLDSKNRVINSNLRYCIRMANKYVIPGYPLEDLVSEAILGLIEGYEDYDLSYEVRLITYANWHMQKRLSKIQPKQIHAPNTYLALRKKINDTRSQLEQEHSSSIPMDYLAEHLDIKSEFLTDSLYTTYSLDDPEIFSEKVELIERKTMLDIFKEPTLTELWEMLPSEEKLIVGWKTGIYGTPKTSKSLAKELNMSKKAVEDCYKQALTKIKTAYQ